MAQRARGKMNVGWTDRGTADPSSHASPVIGLPDLMLSLVIAAIWKTSADSMPGAALFSEQFTMEKCARARFLGD
jgi:hypothetical protein